MHLTLGGVGDTILNLPHFKTPESNGISKCLNSIVVKRAHAMLPASDLPKSL